MKIFLDANILVTVLCNEYPQFSFCSRLLSLCDNPKFEVYTSPLCIGIAYYFAEKKNGPALALKKIKLLSEKIRIAALDEAVVRKTAADRSVLDFEDGLQYYAALQAQCKSIVTYNKDDFHFSHIEVLTAEEFLLKHVARLK
jgi:predicted nucleic acid-binding protein